MSELIVSIDIGTSSMKAAAISSGGEVLARTRKKLIMRGSQWVAGDWTYMLDKLFFDICDQVEDRPVDAICISGNGPTLVGGDGCGDTLTWDDELEDEDADDSGSLLIPRLKEFKRRYPEAWRDSRYIYSCPEYVINKLTGANLTILPEERYSKAYWTTESLLKAGFTEKEAEKLPPFVKPGTYAGKTKDYIAPNAKAGIPVYCGAPDFISALVGTNCLEPGLLCDRAGSSEGINFCSDTPLEGEDVRILPSVVPGLWNASVLLPESGTRFSQFKAQLEQKLFDDISYEELVHACLYNPSQEAVYDQGKYLMLQTAMQVRDSLKILLASAAEKNQKIPDRMTVTGGQAANDEWNQMKANVTGMTILVPGCSDAELVGDAVFACMGMGLFSSVQEGARAFHSVAKCFEPESF
ncbi:MAG: hypothetical protein IJR93_10000 [Treponema sp.]|nr:hypothetical protein [Treponema sp.]